MTKNTLILLTFFLSLQSFAATVVGIVRSVHDGDTIRIIEPGKIKETRIRFLGVDTPEIDFQGHGQGQIAYDARDFLKQLTPIGSEVKIVTGPETHDKNNRVLGRVMANGVDVNGELLRQGLGAMYFIAPYDDEVVKKYVQYAKEAYFNKRGLFSYDKVEAQLPYNFRMSVRGYVGNNFVANYETKKLYHPEEVEQVPPYARVFFKYEDMALKKGFTWRE